MVGSSGRGVKRPREAVTASIRFAYEALSNRIFVRKRLAIQAGRHAQGPFQRLVGPEWYFNLLTASRRESLACPINEIAGAQEMQPGERTILTLPVTRFWEHDFL